MTARPVSQFDNFFLRLVPSEQRRASIRRGVIVMGFFLACALLLMGLFHVWTRMQQVQIGYEISSLELRNRELKNRKRELMLEIASLQSPAELEKKAKKQGLIFPAMGKVVHVP